VQFQRPSKRPALDRNDKLGPSEYVHPCMVAMATQITAINLIFIGL